MTTGGGEALHESNASGGSCQLPQELLHNHNSRYLHITDIITQLFQTQTSSSSPLFKVNIAVCAGYHNRYSKSKQPPNDLCIRHKEWREFSPEGATTPYTRFSNMYYHCDPQCLVMVSRL